MLAIFFFIIAFAFCLGTLAYRRDWHCPGAAEVLLGFVLLFNMGITSLLAAYAHLFMGPLIAEQIGWLPGSPFQFEIGMANLSYGILGVLAFWFRGRFWDAAIIGWRTVSSAWPGNVPGDVEVGMTPAGSGMP